eukprot:g29640.t1
MASPLGDSSGFRPPLAESAASIPSLPVTPGGFPALLDAARQQTELVFWIVRSRSVAELIFCAPENLCGDCRRVKLVEENVSELKGIRLQVPDMRASLTSRSRANTLAASASSACRARRLLVARQVGHKIQPIQLRGFAAIDPGSGVSLISPTAKTVLVAGAAAAGVFNNHDNLFVFYFEKAEDLNERSEDFHRVISSLVQEPVLKKVTYYQNVRKDGRDPQEYGYAILATLADASR